MQHEQRIAAEQARGVDPERDVEADALRSIGADQLLGRCIVPLAFHGARSCRNGLSLQARNPHLRVISKRISADPKDDLLSAALPYRFATYLPVFSRGYGASFGEGIRWAPSASHTIPSATTCAAPAPNGTRSTRRHCIRPRAHSPRTPKREQKQHQASGRGLPLAASPRGM